MHEITQHINRGAFPSFYDKASTNRMIRVENVYNELYKGIPHKLIFSGNFKYTAMEQIIENFERLYADFRQLGSTSQFISDGFWVGKEGTLYAGGILDVKMHGVDSKSAGMSSLFGGDNDISTAELKKLAELAERGSAEDIFAKVSLGLTFAGHDEEQAMAVHALLYPFKITTASSLYILTNEYGELTFSPMPMDPMEVDLADNYGADFVDVHKKIVDSLNNVKSGLYLFHGVPGSGKSTYIKRLLNGEVKRKIAYIPVSLISSLVAPDMLPLLMDNKDIILVIEDAEQGLRSREEDVGNSALVSSILNLTDGLIGQSLNITIIATFNLDREHIDKALLRKGRLKVSHEFDKLSIADAKALLVKLGKPDIVVEEPMTLADIYNIEVETGHVEKETPKMGFGF